MGSSHSQPVAPVEFDQNLLNALADNALSPNPSPARQNSLDAQIQARIQAELEQLRAEEKKVREQIEAALEKENLDRERALANDPDSVASSASLLVDLDEVRAKVDRFHARKDLAQYPIVQEARDKLVACYKNNTTTPLDCWQQVSLFKTSVSQLEQVRPFYFIVLQLYHLRQQHIKSLQ
ncbi:hypothetical protein MIND_01061700 [Mycena indigotica]|uniref:MICOS complex subunit mic19 n=1 Tax=Mycena indigotica TaxID=2126181 RepID=A0A8H6S9C8_9AGAR|nr:uncharacterized protein MIND_01061700 [Mycena indigotica]KAF7295228.1 hypothetical protein MIND_01061700 [Mycena indigotica]